LSFASSIICFISSALGAAAVVALVVLAGVEAVVVAGAGLIVVVVVVLGGAGLDVVGGAGDRVWATATDAITKRTINDFRNVFMGRFWLGVPPNVKPGIRRQVQHLLLVPFAQ